MEARKRNKRVTIEEKTVTKGASGGMVEGWAAIAGMPVWASLNHFGGNERRATAQGGLVAAARTEIGLLYRAGITAQMRVRHGATVYNITHVNNWQERNESLVLTCETGVNGG